MQTRVVDRYATLLRSPFEDFGECSRSRWFDTSPVTHSSQECFVHQIALIEIRREHYELFKRHFDLLPAVQSEKIYASLERQNPAIQQILRRNSLPSEVVDHECAAIRLHLKRSFI